MNKLNILRWLGFLVKLRKYTLFWFMESLVVNCNCQDPLARIAQSGNPPSHIIIIITIITVIYYSTTTATTTLFLVLLIWLWREAVESIWATSIPCLIIIQKARNNIECKDFVHQQLVKLWTLWLLLSLFSPTGLLHMNNVGFSIHAIHRSGTPRIKHVGWDPAQPHRWISPRSLYV